jgi:lipid-A-disaccharide synthase
MKILVVAGEASGDMHGARLIREIKSTAPDMEFYAVGGERIRSEGAHILFDCQRLAVVGIIEILAHIHIILGCFRLLKNFLRTHKPDLVILIDYPDFNLRLAKIAKKRGIRVVYYISPQIWAWRRNRLKFMSRWVDKMLVIFPFEVPFYSKAGINVEFVGHPLLDSVSPRISQESFKLKSGLKKGEHLIGLMPGSRKGEVLRILPVMLKGAKRLTENHPGKWRFVLILAPTVDQSIIAPLIKKYADILSISMIQGYTYEALKASELAFVASGTATLETAIIGTPMLILYKLSWPTYFIAKTMIKVPAIGLVNLVAREKLFPELIQSNATGEKLAEEAGRILEDPESRRKMIQGMSRVRQELGQAGAAGRAAEAVIRFLKESEENESEELKGSPTRPLNQP